MLEWHPAPVPLPGKSHGWRSLEGCSPWGHWESDTTEQLHFHFSLSCIGEGNGSPLQYSCLENPRDGGAWWAAVYGVTQSRTRLKWLSSSSSSCCIRVLTCILLFTSHKDLLISVQFSHSVVSDRPPCPSPAPGVHSNSRPSSCHPAISFSVVPFSSCPQSLPASVFSSESTLRMK